MQVLTSVWRGCSLLCSPPSLAAVVWDLSTCGCPGPHCSPCPPIPDTTSLGAVLSSIRLHCSGDCYSGWVISIRNLCMPHSLCYSFSHPPTPFNSLITTTQTQTKVCLESSRIVIGLFAFKSRPFPLRDAAFCLVTSGQGFLKFIKRQI